ncbi:unnamed protein product, partial [Prorocentrum cordatum]
DARPVFEYIQYLRNPNAPKPKLVILENVGGMLAPFRNPKFSEFKCPLDYLMRGTSCIADPKTKKNKPFKHGLEFLPDYKATYFTLDARTAGLPMRRRRVFILLVRVDVLEAAEVDISFAAALVAHIKTRPIERKPIDDFITPEMVLPSSYKKVKEDRQRLTVKGWEKINAARSKKGTKLLKLPNGKKVGQTGVSLFGKSASKEVLNQVSEREVESINFVYERLGIGNIPDELTININESTGRNTTGVGNIRMSTGSRIWYKKGNCLLNHATIFKIFGWDPATITIPDGVFPTALKRLQGNMIAIPTIGTALIVAIAFLPELSEWRKGHPLNPNKGKRVVSQAECVGV